MLRSQSDQQETIETLLVNFEFYWFQAPKLQASAPKSAVHVTAAHLKAYREDGVVHLPGAFGEDWVQYLRDAFQQGMEKPGKYAEFIGKETTWDTLFAARSSLGSVLG